MRRALVLITALLCVLPLGARRYPFIHTERNTLQFPGGKSREFEVFSRKLDSIAVWGSGSLKVLQVGGSHVQAGIWPDRIRRNFLSLRYGIDGGRGLVFPFAAAQTGTPSSYTTTATGNWDYSRCLHPGRDMGLPGVEVTALDTSARAAIDLLPKGTQTMRHRYVFDRVTVMGYGSMRPVLLLSPKDTLRGRKEGNLWNFELPYYRDWIQLGFEAPSGQFTLEGIYLDKSCGGFTMSEAGINGASTRSWLGCTHWEDNLRVVAPDMVIFSIGINDIQGNDFSAKEFKERYRELIGMVRRVNPRCAIVFSGINDSCMRRGKAVNPHTEAVQKAFRDLAREYKAAFWDMYDIMGGYGSMALWQEAGLAQPDRIHFTAAGYNLLGDMLFDAIYDATR